MKKTSLTEGRGRRTREGDFYLWKGRLLLEEQMGGLFSKVGGFAPSCVGSE